MSADPADTELAAQYEAYPYPARDPREEAKRLLIGSPGHLREIDYWVFGARRPEDRFLRVLIAGCGTGDGAIMLATHLARAGRPGEVICLDRSGAALNIARERAAARGLENIRFVQGSLLSDPFPVEGQFDYIDCCGVLHHLPDPDATLARLTERLAPGGGMGLMVYAPYGRTGVYMLQDALSSLAPHDQTPADRLDIARRVMRNLPATAWLRANGNFGDHLSGGDAGLYDLLLNPRDRAYDVRAFHRLIGGAGLEISCLMEPARYDPSLFLPDPRLRTRLGELSPVERAAVAEELTGNMATHVAYVVRSGERISPPDPLDDASVPVMREIPGIELARQMTPDHRLMFEFGTLVVPVPLPPQTRGLLPLIDGERTVGELAAALEGRGVGRSQFDRVWGEAFSALESLNRVLLRGPRTAAK
ncbi:class I SAM-dependent methyltransferase [Acetobacter sp. AN02]|uniref:class I SAM-dependent methyltransferase n=1 Tax=Acetobacter sp. AN02 TaxID=2894186 RepID=UPI0024344BBF|nr:class I SAM-dependent methyltransferase [Acetobacter sp. AN02]MDG6094090.1 class I SAM-dependent methyltransferase [Acetobacter sp. AN02]